MAHNKLYRNFIILQEDERGYSHSNDKTLSGYAKVEAKGDKCKVSFYAQNLNKEDNYSMVLICSKRDLKQLIDLGPLAINEVGKGDTSKEYYVNNIAGLGISYEKISGAAICTIRNNEPEFVMHGFMNGEESAENWRKFKFIKADSKKYINKLELEPKKKDITDSDITSKVVVPEINNVEASLAKSVKQQSELVERKIDENIDDDRRKNKENKYNKCNEYDNYDKCDKHDKSDECEKHEKCEKYDKHNKYDEYDKFEKYGIYDKHEDIEEAINKLAKNLNICENIIDLKINHISEDITVYGFIKYKKDYDCKWEKFKLEKKYKDDYQKLNYVQSNHKRIEENFKLDRLDTIDFDGYEKDIQQGNLNNATKQGTMGQQGMVSTGKMGTGTQIQPEVGNASNPMNTGTEIQPELKTADQINTQDIDQMGMKKITPIVTEAPTSQSNSKLDLNDVEPMNLNNNQQSTTNQGFNINGEITVYFEKLAEDFQPYHGNLADINHCKWYKIDVNNIEDLSDDSNYNQYTLAYYPMLNYYPYISKAGYFLLGYKCNRNGDIQYIVYAIPGGKGKNEQPYGGRTGFVTWTNDNNNGKGYWLMFYDFKNSSIVIPTR